MTRTERREQERQVAKLENAAKRTYKPPAQPVVPGPWQINAVTFSLLLLATIALYVADLRLGFFNLDDPGYVVDNPWIQKATAANLLHILSTPYFANYSPVHLLSYLIDHAVAGLNPFAFHLSSNIWAGIVAGFVFLLALALTRRRDVAIGAAVLFIVHPSHVEAVAWISSRKDLVAAAFALPSLLAYLRYRQGGQTAFRWYIASAVLFVFAVAGKLSVATFPIIFLALDVFVEKRPFKQSLIDKIPFVVIPAVFAWVVASVQPQTGRHPDPYVLAMALLQNIWLLSGFARYVLYRVAPELGANIAFQVGAAIALLAAFVAPLLLRRRAPMVMVLIYWILFAFIPTQVLSFFHPVTDRYVFFPSVAATILIAWGLFVAADRYGRRFVLAAIVLLAIITVAWGRTTLSYLAEWRDPRSVWYAAAQKSADSQVFWNLGVYYQDIADGLGVKPRVARLSDAEEARVASAIWAGDSRLPSLLGEWTSGQHGGPVEGQYQGYLRTFAWDDFDRALKTRGNRIMPSIYFRRGLILVDRGDGPGARKEFLAALDEASRHQYAEAREEMTVKSQNALGIVAWTAGDYQEALRWLRTAEAEQTRFGGNWVPDLTTNRQRLEGIISRPQNH